MSCADTYSWIKSTWTTNLLWEEMPGSEVNLEWWAPDQSCGGKDNKSSCRYLSLSYMQQPQIPEINHVAADWCGHVHSHICRKQKSSSLQEDSSSHLLPFFGVRKGKLMFRWCFFFVIIILQKPLGHFSFICLSKFYLALVRSSSSSGEEELNIQMINCITSWGQVYFNTFPWVKVTNSIHRKSVKWVFSQYVFEIGPECFLQISY